MISQDCARQIFNLHSQIKATNEAIRILKDVKDNAEKENGLESIRDHWGNHMTIELHIPERFIKPGSSSFASSRIYQISCADAILVLENHIVRLSKALEKENEIALQEMQEGK